MPEWFNPQRGYYIAKYHGKTLEVVRNKDATDKRRYVAQVNGVILPHPCHTIPQAKTKAQKWADSSGFDDVPDPRPPPEETTDLANEALSSLSARYSNGAIVPYVDPDVPIPAGDAVMIAFTITGFLPVDSFSQNVSNLQAAVDMLRDVGGAIECDIKPPGKVKL